MNQKTLISIIVRVYKKKQMTISSLNRDYVRDCMEVLGEGRRTQSFVLLKAKPFPELIIFFLHSSLDKNEYPPAIISKQEHIFIANITKVG